MKREKFILKELQKIIEIDGFIENSDCVYTLHDLAENINVEYDDIVLVCEKYFNSESTHNKYGDFEKYYYSKDLNFNNIESFYSYFSIGE